MQVSEAHPYSVKCIDLVVCLLLSINAAACFLHLKMYPRCISYCNDALEINRQSVKALFRRARAFRLQDKFNEAEIDLVTLQSIVDEELDSRQVEKELELLRDSQQKYDAVSKQFARRAIK